MSCSLETTRKRKAEAAFLRKSANKRVIQDTLAQCQKDPAKSEVARSHVCMLPGHLQRESCTDLRGTGSIEVEICDEDCVVVAARCCQEGGTSVWLLNMAAASTPGGGARSGCNAQEEHLCRCSNLLPHLEHAAAEGKYPLHRWYGEVPDFRILVHEKIEFFKHPRDYRTLRRQDRFEIGVLTAAAEKVRGERKLGPNAERFIGWLLDTAIMQGCTHLVLSAWGCGAFGQCPHAVAKCFQQNFAKITHVKLKVIFAILDDHNSTDNLAAFQSVFMTRVNRGTSECSDRSARVNIS